VLEVLVLVLAGCAGAAVVFEHITIRLLAYRKKSLKKGNITKIADP
jgi:hypothetical protein